MRKAAIWLLVSTVSVIPLAIGFAIGLAVVQLVLAGKSSPIHGQLSAQIIANPDLHVHLSGYDLLFFGLVWCFLGRLPMGYLEALAARR